MSKQRENHPFISIWFGNFFEPFYSDYEATRKGIAEVVEPRLQQHQSRFEAVGGFLCALSRRSGQPVCRDARVHDGGGGETRPGLHLPRALSLRRQSLSEHPRVSPPVRGEEPMRPNGQPMGTYKYWSPKAQATMVEHVKGLLKLYGKGMRRRADGKIIMQTMFEPIPKPSFDAGRQTEISRVVGKTLRRRHFQTESALRSRGKILFRTEAG